MTPANASSTIYSLCASDFFPPDVKCRSKGHYCKMNMNNVMENAINYRQALPSWTKKSRIIGLSDYTSRCKIPHFIKVKFHPEHKLFTCSYSVSTLTTSRRMERHCHASLKCRADAYEMAVNYEEDFAKCQKQIKPYDYGFSNDGHRFL